MVEMLTFVYGDIYFKMENMEQGKINIAQALFILISLSKKSSTVK